jgi:hypothetical protein
MFNVVPSDPMRRACPSSRSAIMQCGVIMRWRSERGRSLFAARSRASRGRHAHPPEELLMSSRVGTTLGAGRAHGLVASRSSLVSGSSSRHRASRLQPAIRQRFPTDKCGQAQAGEAADPR